MATSSSYRSSDESNGKEEQFEILDLSKMRNIESKFNQIFGEVTKMSAAKQLAIGGSTGWVSGYCAAKVGKAAAITIGATFITIQVAQYNGFISVDWAKVNQAVMRAKGEVRKKINRKGSPVIKAAKQFYQDNMFLAAGFAGGFFIGFLL